MNKLFLMNPAEMGLSIALRVKTLRLMKNWTREVLAMRAGVSVSSLRRFETKGLASLELVIKLAFALSRLEEFSALFLPPPAQSIAELERSAAGSLRKRGRKAPHAVPDK
ncbi:MAG: helix-turn-helix transcriptional regulator [Bacteroidetes bacterium]|nr:helix-turn-helix transcriptional regulator [Bacteroidota bacterium]